MDTCAGFALGQVVALLPLGICGHLRGPWGSSGTGPGSSPGRTLLPGAHMQCRPSALGSRQSRTEALAQVPGAPHL